MEQLLLHGRKETNLPPHEQNPEKTFEELKADIVTHKIPSSEFFFFILLYKVQYYYTFNMFQYTHSEITIDLIMIQEQLKNHIRARTSGVILCLSSPVFTFAPLTAQYCKIPSVSYTAESTAFAFYFEG